LPFAINKEINCEKNESLIALQIARVLNFNVSKINNDDSTWHCVFDVTSASNWQKNW